MNGWLAKRSDNWFIQIYSYSVQSIFSMHAEHALSRGVWGHAPIEKFCKFSLFSIKFSNIFDSLCLSVQAL